MAAVRFAARRLTGQHQQQAILRTAVASEQRVLSRGRFTSSAAKKGPKVNTEHPSVSGDTLLRTADQKKEELFDLLDQIQRNKGIAYMGRKEDRWLLQRLTSHVDRRPSNPQWRHYLRENAVNRFCAATATFLTFLYMVEKRCEKFREQTLTAKPVSPV